MSRDDSKALTRTALIDAGAAVFRERGFARARVEEIAARAGLTTGALYAHFGSKEGLFLAVIELASAYTTNDLAELAGIAVATATPSPADPPGPTADRPVPRLRLDPTLGPLPDVSLAARRRLPQPDRTGLAGLGDAWFARQVADVGWFRLNVEFHLTALGNPQLHARLVDIQREARRWLAWLFDAVASDRGRRFTEPVSTMVQTAWALGYGLLLEWITDPGSVPPHRYGDLLEELFLAATEERPDRLPDSPSGARSTTSNDEEESS